MNFDQLVDLCHRTHEELGSRAIRAADAHLVVRNWLFGLYITEFEQNGTDRAAYGARVIESLADRLSPLKVKGTSATRLKLYRSFYRIFSIGPTLSDQLQKLLPNAPEKSPTVSDLSSKERSRALSSLPSGLMSHFVLGWSHYVELLTIDGAEERLFYEIEAAANQWSVRELQRQIASAVVSAPRFRLQGRGRSPSGPKIQAQRAVKPKSKNSASFTSYPLPATAATPLSSFCLLRFATVGSQPTHSTFPQPMRYRAGVPTSSFLLRFPPVAVFATTPGSGFVEMILHLPIQNQPHSLPATSYSLLS